MKNSNQVHYKGVIFCKEFNSKMHKHDDLYLCGKCDHVLNIKKGEWETREINDMKKQNFLIERQEMNPHTLGNRNGNSNSFTSYIKQTRWKTISILENFDTLEAVEYFKYHFKNKGYRLATQLGLNTIVDNGKSIY